MNQIEVKKNGRLLKDSKNIINPKGVEIIEI